MQSKSVAVPMLAALAVLASVLLSTAGQGEAYREVEALEVRRMMETGNPLVIFPLSRIEYNDLHIEGSVNIPFEDLAQGLPDDLDRPLIFYTIAPRCSASWRAAEKAFQLGHRQVYAFRKGLPAWVAAGYPTHSIEKLPQVESRAVSTEKLLAMLQQEEDFVLVDVSLERDARKFWIDTPRRLHIPANEMERRYREIPRGKKVVVMCLQGKRSPAIVRYLTAKGFENLYHLEGGLQAWILEGRPVATSSS